MHFNNTFSMDKFNIYIYSKGLKYVSTKCNFAKNKSTLLLNLFYDNFINVMDTIGTEKYE